jgi:FKBP-type peptidyl-prolyl cis-trans isomerase SlyD
MSQNGALTIGDGKVVTIHYTLRDDDGDVVDSSVGDDPLAYVHGTGGIVEGLEQEIAKHSIGDSFKVVVPPAQGYGDVEGPGPRPIPRRAFPSDVEIEPGMQFFVRDEDGEPLPLWVVEVDGEQVFVDTNHPLAGETLHFEVEILGVREATAEELEHGHVHGPGGAHHEHE